MQSERGAELLRAFRVWSHGPDYRHAFLPVICTAIRASEKEEPLVKELLEQLEDQGETVFLAGRGWFVPQREGWLAGTLTLVRKGFGFVRPLIEDPRGDVFIPARRLRDAHHGDRVLVGIQKPRRGEPAVAREGRSGKILEVLERSPRVIPGIYWASEGGSGVVEPLRHESVREIWIDSAFRAGVSDGDRVLARLHQGPTVHGLPPGQVVCALAPEGTWKSDLQVVCAEHQLREEFPVEVEQAAAAFPTEIPAAEIERRCDHRGIPFVTIDPEDAKDFDDALAVIESPSGGVRLGVAIADVSHFVEPGSAIDAEALLRGTSVYIPGKTIPMLPEKLSNDLCSLRPGVDRLAKVVWIDVGESGQFEDFFVEQAVIRSACRFTYQEAEEILKQHFLVPEDLDSSTSLTALEQLIVDLNRVRVLLHDRRIEQG
ncbi:MAG: RNB domain-containing ribonuclease, partial [Planctomycetota bacterium]